MRRAVFVALMMSLVCTVLSAQEQQCPGTDPYITTFCADQYNTCFNDNDGKNCDSQSCPAYCDNEYDTCMYGQVRDDYWENPVYSRTLDTSTIGGGNGCIDGCSAGDFACQVLRVDSDPYRRYDTHWAQVEHQHRVCDDGYEYDMIANYIDHPSSLCYQHDDSCWADYPNGGDPYLRQDLNNWYQFTEDGSQIIIHP